MIYVGYNVSFEKKNCLKSRKGVSIVLMHFLFKGMNKILELWLAPMNNIDNMEKL
jgi:hypothetical protein